MSFSLYSFIQSFYTEEQCARYLFQLKYGLSHECSKCGSKRMSYLKSRFSTFYCLDCKKQLSLTSNAVFEYSKLSLQQWFIACYLMSKDKRGISALGLARELDISYNPAYLMLNQLRELMAQRERKYKLQGDIEMDEFFVGGSGGKAGRGTSKAKVIIALSFLYQDVMDNDTQDEYEVDNPYSDIVERKTPLYLKMRVVDDLKADTINEFVLDSIEEGSAITTDGYKGYNKLLDAGVSRVIEKFDKNERNYRKLHLVITNLKAFINGTYHGVSKENLQTYLDEFTYRFNRRNIHESLFDRVLKLAIKI